MEYRTLPRGGERVSVLGMGSASIGMQPQQQIIRTVRAAVESGINCFDMAGSHGTIFPAYGEALRDVRRQVFLQVHFGADYSSGEYGWTTDFECVRRSVAWQLENLRTDYIDIGFLHCLDEASDLEAYEKNGVLDYVLALKKQGMIRHIGLSSHSPALAQRILALGIVDVLMFSINPLYDYGQGEFGFGENQERYALYRRCQKEGVAITVMKPFCGGKLLDERQSPFGVALRRAQCIQYALDKPGVVSVLPGYGSEAELRDVLRFFEADAAERDYSCISSFAPQSAMGSCVYCRHCHPCPQGLDVALINQYYDLALLGDALAREHYLTLERKAGDCTACGHCDGRCPFHVAQSQRMQTILEYFGQ